MSKYKITQDYLKSIFTYEDGQLVWAKKLAARVKIGQPAGTSDKAGYIQIGLKGKIYRAHHLIWVYHCGKWPEQLDHINGIKWDNRIENLRESTQLQNTRNRPQNKNSSSSYKGVHKAPTGRFYAKICVEGTHIYLGAFSDEINAAEAYDTAAKKYFGEFAYTNFV